MAEDRDEERSEPATPRRREEARERGQVARSAELSASVTLLAAVLALQFLGRPLFGGLAGSVARALADFGTLDGGSDELLLRFGGAFALVGGGFLPFVGIVLAAALAVNLLQVGVLFTGAPLAPDPERLNPAAGLGRIFSWRGVAKLLGALLKVAIVGVVVYVTLWGERVRLLELSGFGFEEIVGSGVELMLALSMRVALSLLVLSILEYGFQRWQHEQDLRMSKRELREELKRYEGDPRIRERRRAIQRRLSLQRMMEVVPRAAVVITNPTHLSVAVQYDKDAMDAPVVVAKGAEQLALRIREVAMEHGIPIVERKDLARALYKDVDVGQAVPPGLYQAIAEILAFVYRLKGNAAAA